MPEIAASESETRRTAPPQVVVTRRDDETILLDHPVLLPEIEGSLPARLRHWASRTPDAPFLSEGERTLSFGEAETRCLAVARRLIGLPIGTEAPLMIIGANGIDHAVAMLAATSIGIPVAIVSPAYAADNAAPWQKLARVVDMITPGIVLADEPATTAAALAAAGRLIRVESLRNLTWLDALPESATSEAETAVGPDTVAKLLLTSGSTGTPKAVLNTQRMMVSNMVALAEVWPFLAERPPVLVDWLPWNHTFGGNCCFDIALWFGGHMAVDRGRAAPGLIGHTVTAIREHRPTVYFNVPLGYELLLPYLETDPAFAAEFFGGINFLFNAGAALPSSTRLRLEAVGRAATGRAPNIAGGWGSTETAPFSTALAFPTDEAANLGLPIPGTTIKMVPDGARYELRVRGPNVTPGYWRDHDLTRAAFDEEGFYRIGDAGRFADPADPSAGIVFDGRVAENFKLLTGTFVNVGALRLATISAGEGLISDVAVVGEGRGEIGVIVFANEAACHELLGESGCGVPDCAATAHPVVAERLGLLLRLHNAANRASSVRIARFVVADRPPDPAQDEITDKGYLNQRRVIANRVDLVERLYTEGARL